MITVLYPIYNLYNQPERLQAFNTSLKELDPRFNVMISDSGDHASYTVIDPMRPFNYIHHRFNDKLFNKSKTINEGFKYIYDDLFIILDAEIIMEPNIYDKLLNIRFKDNIGLAITKHLHCNEPFLEKNYKELTLKFGDTKELFLNLKGKVKYTKNNITIHNYKPGRFLFTNKETFDQIRFDESYIGYGGHDYKFMFDFCYKTQRQVTCLDTYDIHLYHPNDRKTTEKNYFEVNNTKVWESLSALNCKDSIIKNAYVLVSI